MAIPNEKLQEVLREIEAKASFSAQQLQIVRGQIASKNREKRMLQLSSSELDTVPVETPVYDGVGKMFVLTTTKEIQSRQTKESGDVDKELDNLGKKLHYLETTYNNAQQHLERIFKGSAGQS
ncbi:Prefoldin [Neohortaea acidophila]|uniref:Prefoldin n=1 Tax=Neohortaea acidophila TaxID=245834 RepID=A0A6A6PY21_9PEZI|nr:Prefoldin [Neohortaea acidophila]KAF2484403.1 Prefoldin [Neohortaea acidophila]